MTRWIKVHWVIWALLVLVVLAGVLINKLSSGKLVTIELEPGASVDVSIFRPIPHPISLLIGFKRGAWKDKRPELGEYSYKTDPWKKEKILEFSNPGTPIKISVRGNDIEVIYEAMPNSGYTKKLIHRNLVPFVDDGNPNVFKWPPATPSLIVPSGNSTLNISVVDVGQQLLGEQVSLLIKSPVGFKAVAEGYGFLWWFIFWPVYVATLFVYALILLWIPYRHRMPNEEW